jgi:glycerate dehydrogenase
MKIVVTDGYTLNPGDLSWDEIASLGTIEVYDRTPSNLITERCKDADIILTNKVPLNNNTISQLPNLKMISVLATGYNVIDVKAASEKGIVVCNVPAYGTASVAQHTFALLLELSNGVGLNAQSVANGEWVSSKDWCYSQVAITELAGKTLGIVGFGNIGQQVARIAHAFGMRIVYHNRSEKHSDIAERRDVQRLFAESDFISLHCPLTPENHQFVNSSLLGLMKKTACIINTARGQLINEEDLAGALNNEQIASAALDVLSTEPPSKENPLLSAKNCIITPHNAWMSKEARERIMETTYRNVKEFISGQSPANRVNGQA